MWSDLFTYRLYWRYQEDVIQSLKNKDYDWTITMCNQIIEWYKRDKELMEDDKMEFLFFFEIFLGVSYDIVWLFDLAKMTYENILWYQEYDEEAEWIKYARLIARDRLAWNKENIWKYIDKIVDTYND